LRGGVEPVKATGWCLSFSLRDKVKGSRRKDARFEPILSFSFREKVARSAG
jgi:hypothetical protein